VNTGNVLLILALAAGGLGVALRSVALFDLEGEKWRRSERWGAFALLVQCALVVGAFALLVWDFLARDLGYKYTWEHTDVTYPLHYRLAGVWAGQTGTILLWSALLAAFLATEVWRSLRNGREDPTRSPRRIVVALLAVLVLSFTGFMLADGMFEKTEPQLLAFAATRDGRGLQESLVTPLMVIHPPVQFVAYALLALPATWALAGWWTGASARAWVRPARKWARWAWLFATLGLGLGGLWAYYVLSFGGYWAWDPVETANLLPWIALTAFLHAGNHLDKFGDFPTAAPSLAFLGAWLAVFATFSTRSGLWVSVHAFTDPTNKFSPDAAWRLLAILDVHLPTRFFIGLLAASALIAWSFLARHVAIRARLSSVARIFSQAYIALLALLAGLAAAAPGVFLGASLEAGSHLGEPVIGAAALWGALLGVPIVLLYLRGIEPDVTPKVKPLWKDLLTTRRLMAAGVTMFAIGLTVTLLLDFQVVNGLNRAVFDIRAPMIVLPMMSILTLMLAKEPLGHRGAIILALTGLVTGGIAAALFRDDLVVAISVPVLIAALIASVAKIVHVNRGSAATKQVRLAGGLLLLASLLGMVMWSNPPSHEEIGPFMLNAGAVGGALFWMLAFVGLLGALSALRAASHGLAVVGAVGATLAAGYGIGALLALIALVLLVRNRGAFFTPLGLAALTRREAPRLVQTGIYLIHFAVILGLVGYAGSTYAKEQAFFDLAPGEVGELGGHTFTVETIHGVAAPNGAFLDKVVVDLAVERDGKNVGQGELEFYYKGAPVNHYDPRLDIQRGFVRDLYLSPLAMRARGGEMVPAHGESCTRAGEGLCLRNTDLASVAFEATILPLVAFVWAGLWMMGAGMLLVLGGSAFMPAAADRATAKTTAPEARHEIARPLQAGQSEGGDP
jgi:cytochrome c biogenesis factor